MRIATWNVNSLKQRMPRLLPWLDERRPDVVCLQETKLADDALAQLLGDALEERGYDVAAHGEAAWNGVAILSRVGLADVVRGLEGGPGFPHQEARAIAATCAGVRIVSPALISAISACSAIRRRWRPLRPAKTGISASTCATSFGVPFE